MSKNIPTYPWDDDEIPRIGNRNPDIRFQDIDVYKRQIVAGSARSMGITTDLNK